MTAVWYLLDGQSHIKPFVYQNRGPMKKSSTTAKLAASESQIRSMQLAHERLADALTSRENANMELRAELDNVRAELRNTRTDRAILIRSVHCLMTGEPLKTDAVVEG